MDALTELERRAVAFHEAEAVLEKRRRALHNAMARARLEGFTLRRIGDVAGISFKGVDKILQRGKPSPPPA